MRKWRTGLLKKLKMLFDLGICCGDPLVELRILRRVDGLKVVF